MCRCNPSIKTPYCGKENCKWPNNWSLQQKYIKLLELSGISEQTVEEEIRKDTELKRLIEARYAK